MTFLISSATLIKKITNSQITERRYRSPGQYKTTWAINSQR